MCLLPVIVGTSSQNPDLYMGIELECLVTKAVGDIANRQLRV